MSRLRTHESPTIKDNRPPLGAYETAAKYAPVDRCKLFDWLLIEALFCAYDDLFATLGRHTVQANTMRINLKDIEMGEVIDTGGSGAVISYWYTLDLPRVA